MKITDAWVYDPAYDGHLLVPYLCVEVNERPTATIPDEAFSEGWSVGKYGPFVKYNRFGHNASAVDFNLKFRDRFVPVIDIVLYVRVGDNLDPDFFQHRLDYSLPLSRARQVVRKYHSSWRLLVADREAVKGRLVWRPYQTDPDCRGDRGNCQRRPAELVRVQSLEIPLCEKHRAEHNEQQAAKRTASSSR